MTDKQVRAVLEAARAAMQEQERLIVKAEESSRVRQRLTALYGVERVSSSGSGQSPALAALIRQEEALEELNTRLKEIYQVIDLAKRIVESVKNAQDQNALTYYYLCAWSIGKIARLTERTPRSVRRRLDAAIYRLGRE